MHRAPVSCRRRAAERAERAERAIRRVRVLLHGAVRLAEDAERDGAFPQRRERDVGLLGGEREQEAVAHLAHDRLDLELGALRACEKVRQHGLRIGQAQSSLGRRVDRAGREREPHLEESVKTL